MKAKKEWNEKDFIIVKGALVNYFNYKVFKNHRGEDVAMPGVFESLEMILGLPYTSSSKYAMMGLDCNAIFYHPYEDNFHYDHVFMTEENNVMLVLMDSMEKEIIIQLT